MPLFAPSVLHQVRERAAHVHHVQKTDYVKSALRLGDLGKASVADGSWARESTLRRAICRGTEWGMWGAA